MADIKQEWIDNAGPKRSEIDVMRSICSNLPSIHAFQPDIQSLAEFALNPSLPLKLLDFGAGMLRNTVGLLEMSKYWKVTAYDSEAMLDRGTLWFRSRLRQAYMYNRLRLTSNWQGIKDERFDAIICILVLQHIDESPLRDKLREFTRMSDKLCVAGRRSLDDVRLETGWTPIWPIIKEYWEPIKVGGNLDEGDKHDHCIAVFKPKV